MRWSIYPNERPYSGPVCTVDFSSIENSKLKKSDPRNTPNFSSFCMINNVYVHDCFMCFVVERRQQRWPAPYYHIIYICEDGRFPESESCVTIPNSDSLSSSNETWVIPEIRSWKSTCNVWAWCQKAIGGIYFTEKWRVETIQPNLEFDNFKPRLKNGIFKWISWLNASFFGGDDRSFSERESQHPI